jgi:hypothetical protein
MQYAITSALGAFTAFLIVNALPVSFAMNALHSIARILH